MAAKTKRATSERTARAPNVANVVIEISSKSGITMTAREKLSSRQAVRRFVREVLNDGMAYAAHKAAPCATPRLEAHGTKGEQMRGTVKSLDPRGHGIIRAEDGSKVAFLFAAVMTRRILVLGERVTFSVRRVQDNVFAENITHEVDRRQFL